MRTYVITGYDRDGRSQYYARNVPEDCALDEIQAARAEEWTNVTASPESF